MKTKSQYSVANYGPVFYTNTWLKARSFASRCLKRGYVIDPDTRKHNPINPRGLLLSNLTNGSEQFIN